MQHAAVDDAAARGTVVRVKSADAHVAAVDAEIQIISAPLHGVFKPRRSLKICCAQYRDRRLRLIAVISKIERGDRRVDGVQRGTRCRGVENKALDTRVTII